MDKKIFSVFFCAVLAAFPAAAQESSTTHGADYPETMEAGEGITVTGTRTEKRLADTPVITEIITAGEIAASGAATLNDVFADYGLMHRSSAMGDYVMLQGMDAGRVLYLVNGRRIAGRTGQRLNTSTVAVSSIERIEIVRGPQSALYGSEGIGGVINIITKTPEDGFSYSASVQNRMYFAHDDQGTDENEARDLFSDIVPFQEQTASFRAGFGLGPLRNGVSIESGRGSFYGRETGSSGTGAALPEYYRYGGSLDSSLSIGSLGEIRLGGSFMTRREDSVTYSTGNLARKDYFRGEGYAEAGIVPFAASTLTLRFYDTFYEREDDAWTSTTNKWASETTPEVETENLAAFEALMTYTGLPHFVFSGGLEAALHGMEHYEFTDDVFIDREALFFQAEWFDTGRFSVIGGIRGERNSQFGFIAVPKLSGMIHLGSHLRLLGGAGMGYRAPAFNELYRDYTGGRGNSRYHIVPNGDLKPELSVSGSLGAELSAGRSFFQLNAWYTELFDEIKTNNKTGETDQASVRIDRRENIDRSLRTGFDTEGKLYFLAHGWFSAGYSFVFAWNRSAALEMHDQPAHTAKASLGFEYRPLGINTYIQGRFFSPRGDDAYDEGEYRFILDLHYNMNLGAHVRFHVSLENITGARYYFGPSTGQSLLLGLSIDG